MSGFSCPDCDLTFAHEHGFVTTPSGAEIPAILSVPADERAEVRDSETGEVIFPAVKGPLKVIEGGLRPTTKSREGE